MAFARGIYGVEYNPAGGSDESHPLRWFFFLLVVIAITSLLVTRGCRRNTVPAIAEPPPRPVRPAPPPAPPKDVRPSNPVQPSNISTVKPSNGQPIKRDGERPHEPQQTQRPAMPPPATPTVNATNWLETARTRPNAEAALLARLADAERLGNKRIARDTLEKLRRSSAMADLDDPFARRLGALNAELLFSTTPGERDGWTVPVTVKRGDSAQRIAREHGTTLAAVLRLNALKDANRIRTGDTLRILEFPRAVLVVHAGLRFADISLNGRFFKRYDLALPNKPSAGSYPVTRDDGPMDRFTALGLKFAQQDRDELALLLAPGSRIIVSPL